MKPLQRAARRVPPAARRVAVLVAILTAVDLALIMWLWGSRPVITGPGISFGVLVLAFAFVEWQVIHIQFRAEASSFSLLEIPLVIGVVYAEPHVLIGAAMLGMVLGLSVARRQSLLKVAFNVVNIGLYAAIAWVVADTVVGGRELDPASWLGIFLATACGTMLTVTSIIVAISLTEGPPGRRPAGRLIGFALAMSSANTALGLVAAILLPSDGFGIALLLVPAAMVLLAFRMFASERAQRERVEFLYRSSRLLEAGDSEDAPAALLEASREMFRSELAALVLLPDDDQPAISWVGTETEYSSRRLSSEEADLLRDAFDAIEEPVLVAPADTDRTARVVRMLGGRDAIVARMATDERELGLLVIANRLGEVRTFSDGELQVLAALAAQSGFLLHNDRLEQALTELQKLERQLAHQATHDTLTGLPNRSLFTHHLDEVAAGDDPFAVFFIDLDDFKIVNDTRGHSAGDELLIVIAERIKRLLRPIDTAARFGGDEFAVLVRDHPFPREVADRIVASVSEPIDLDGTTVQVGCSVGIAHSEDGRDPQSILQQADLAMYQTKRSGKRGVVEYSPAIDGRRDIGFRASLRDAISTGQLELHYQPIVDLAADRICGLEALVRWRSPDRGLLLPGEFIAEAEKDGFIIPIDRWVLEQATADLRTVRQEFPDLFTAVNISARHLQAPDLVEHIERLEPGLGGFSDRLVLEVTETALMGELERSRTNVDAIRDLGIRFALDDFGTGYSSIGYLREFDIDILKIARPFVAAAVCSPRDREFAQAMIELGHALGLQIIGEGVEQIEEAATLRDLGGEMAQGFLFARPMSFDDVLAVLRREAGLPTRPVVGLTLR